MLLGAVVLPTALLQVTLLVPLLDSRVVLHLFNSPLEALPLQQRGAQLQELQSPAQHSLVEGLRELASRGSLTRFQ